MWQKLSRIAVVGLIVAVPGFVGCELESSKSLHHNMRAVDGGGLRLHILGGEIIALSPEDVEIPVTDPCMVGVEVEYRQGCFSGGCILGTYGCGVGALGVPQFIGFDD